MNERLYHVYILTNELKTVLYTSVTNQLELRIIEHSCARGNRATVTGENNVYSLLYFEPRKSVNDAIAREKENKKSLPEWAQKKQDKACFSK